MNFKILANSGKARVGVLKTKFGTIETPVFMPVGTLATVKGITKEYTSKSGRTRTAKKSREEHIV